MIKRGFGLTLRSQLVVSFLVIMLITLLLGYGYMYTGMLEIEKSRTEETTLKQFRQMEYNFSNFTNDVEKLSYLIINHQDVQDYIGHSSRSEYEAAMLKKRVLDMIDGLLSTYPYAQSIFIYCEDGQIIGSSGNMSFTESGAADQNPFYRSSVYSNTRNSFFKLNWELGERKWFFNYGGNASASDTLLSASKAVKWPYGVKQSATLVLNINEKALNAIYKSISDYQNSHMYIVDGKGRIISNNDTKLIGSRSGAAIDSLRANGSFVTNREDSKIQVVYYRLQHLDWTLIQEIPLDDYIRDILALRNKILVILAASFILAICLSYIWMNRMTKPLKLISAALNKMEKGQIGFMIHYRTRNEFGNLIKRYNKMSAGIAELIEENGKIEEMKRVKEIEALQSQINPHFLYNTLSFIKWMAIAKNAGNIAEAITSLGNMLVPVYRSKSPFTSLSEEMDYVRNYLKIINLRYGDGIKVTFRIDEGILNCRIIKFILQPIVENSIFHGFDDWFRENEIIITGYENGADLEIVVEDNGNGMDEDKLAAVQGGTGQGHVEETGKVSHGLMNINTRLKMHFGEQYAIQVQSRQGSGTKVTIRVPKIQ